MSGMFDLLLDVVISTSLALCMHRRYVCVLASQDSVLWWVCMHNL